MDDLVAEERARAVIDLLEDYGDVSGNIRVAILKQTDIHVLRDWHKLAARAGSIEEFVRQSCLM